MQSQSHGYGGSSNERGSADTSARLNVADPPLESENGWRECDRVLSKGRTKIEQNKVRLTEMLQRWGENEDLLEILPCVQTKFCFTHVQHFTTRSVSHYLFYLQSFFITDILCII